MGNRRSWLAASRHRTTAALQEGRRRRIARREKAGKGRRAGLGGRNAPCFRETKPKFAGISRADGDQARSDAEIDLRQPGRDDDCEQQITDLVLAQRMGRLLDHRPGLLVLVTGDGAGWARGDGMFAAARRFERHGWAVEVLAWADSLNRHLAAWASRPPHALV